MDVIADRIRALKDVEPGSASPDSSQLLPQFRRRRYRHVAVVVGAAVVCVVVAATGLGFVLPSGDHRSTFRPAAPGCLPPEVSIQGNGLDQATGLPTVTISGGSSVQLTPVETGDAAISNLTVTIAVPGADPEVGPQTGPLPAAEVVSEVAAVLSSPVTLAAPRTAGQYPIVASFEYVNNASQCAGEPGSGARSAEIIGYLVTL